MSELFTNFYKYSIKILTLNDNFPLNNYNKKTKLKIALFHK